MKPNIGSGDHGETSVMGGRRVRKDSPQIEALGAIDEATAAIGVARAFVRSVEVKELLQHCQLALQNCAAEVAGAGDKRQTGFDFAAATRTVEEEIKKYDRGAPRPTQFITPGTTQAEAALHLARSVIRRAERRVFALERAGASLPAGVAAYLNRLSDLMFDLAYAESSY